MTLEQFFATPALRNQWVSSRGIQVYVRRQFLCPQGEKVMFKYLVLASINAHRPGRGTYTKLLEFLCANLPYEFHGIVVENICELRFANFHTRQPGWHVHAEYGAGSVKQWTVMWHRPVVGKILCHGPLTVVSKDPLS